MRVKTHQRYGMPSIRPPMTVPMRFLTVLASLLVRIEAQIEDGTFREVYAEEATKLRADLLRSWAILVDLFAFLVYNIFFLNTSGAQTKQSK